MYPPLLPQLSHAGVDEGVARARLLPRLEQLLVAVIGVGGWKGAGRGDGDRSFIRAVNAPTNQPKDMQDEAKSDSPPPGDLLADGVPHHLVEIWHAVPREVVKLAPEELAHEGDGRLRVLALELGVDLCWDRDCGQMWMGQ